MSVCKRGKEKPKTEKNTSDIKTISQASSGTFFWLSRNKAWSLKINNCERAGVHVWDRVSTLTDADAEFPGAPGAPLDVQCLDANKDYVIVSWKQPAVDGGNPIVGYFIDRSVSAPGWRALTAAPNSKT